MVPAPVSATNNGRPFGFIRIRNGTLFWLGHCAEGFIDALGFLLKNRRQNQPTLKSAQAISS